MTEADVERMLAACLPGGHTCDPQAVADGIRAWFGSERQLRQHYPVHALELGMASARLSNGMLLSVEEILNGSKLYDKPCGVYFLISGSEVVYVGQSKQVMARIEDHSRRLKFTRYAFAPFDEKYLDLVESLYIHLLRPRFNGLETVSGVRRPAAPIPLLRLLDMALEAENSLPQTTSSIGEKSMESAIRCGSDT